MTQPFRILQQAAKRITDSFLTAAKHTPESRIGEPLKEVAAKLSGADLDARDIVTGIDHLTGTSRSFEIRHVESVPLADSSGKVIGVKFPAQQDDVEHHVRWARAEHRTSDRFYLTGEPVIAHRPDGSGHRMDYPESEQAPWNSGDGQPPTYVFSHGSPDGRRAVRELSDNGEASDIIVDDRSFGRILAANDHYRRAIEENSRITVDGTCYGDSSAEGMTAELRKAGIDTEVYAFKTKTETRNYPFVDLNTGIEHPGISALTVRVDSPAEQALLADPITHYAPHGHEIDDGT